MENNSTNNTSTKENAKDYYKDKEIQKEILTSTNVNEDDRPRKDGPGGE